MIGTPCTLCTVTLGYEEMRPGTSSAASWVPPVLYAAGKLTVLIRKRPTHWNRLYCRRFPFIVVAVGISLKGYLCARFGVALGGKGECIDSSKWLAASNR